MEAGLHSSRRSLRLVVLGAMALVLGACGVRGPDAGSPQTTLASFQSASFTYPSPVEIVPPERGVPPAVTYGALSNSACLAALADKRVPYVRVAEARGVSLPIRLTGPLHGVTFHSDQPRALRAASPYEILDCRLAVALSDFAKILAAYGVVEAVHMSFYRPPPKSASRGRRASQHESGLAIDLGALVLRDGTKLSILHDWHGRIGDPACGPEARPERVTPASVLLRDVLCGSAESHLFNVSLTPNHNTLHRDHFHLDLTRGARWFLVK